MDDVCNYHKFGYCKYNDQCEKYHVQGECKDGNMCPKIHICSLRHPKMCKRMALEGYCRLESKCAYKHGPRINQHNDEPSEDIKNIKAELDVLKQTVKTLMSIKEEGKVLQKEILDIKEAIKLVIADNKSIADKISLIENDLEYDSEEEKETKKGDRQSIQHAEIITKEDESIFDDIEDLFQIESVDGELLYACNVCNEGLETETEMKEHLNKDHKEIILNISKSADKCVNKSKVEEHYSCKACTLLGGSEFISTTYKETNDHMLKHLEMSNKKIEVKEISEAEQSFDNSDLYAGFDEDGNRIAESESEEQ